MRWLPPVTVALVLVVFAPWLESAFHTPKLVVLALGLLLALPSVYRNWRRLPVPMLVFASAVGLSATVNGAWSAPSTAVLLVGALAVAAFSTFEVDAKQTASIIGAALLVVCGLTVLQTFGLFIFGASGRMTRSSTLGNPDFVASAVAAVAWVCWPLRPAMRIALGALVVLALSFTQSFATLASVSVAAMFLVARLPNVRRWLLPAAVLVVGVLSLGVFDREPLRALRGRWYLTQVVTPHLLDAPLAGLGPGAIELNWPQWELDLWRSRCGHDAACVQAHPEFPFNGLQNHVHDDWLELWLELGPLAAFALAFWFVRRLRDPGQPLVMAALLVLISRSLFDFPLHRPADWACLALLACWRADGTRTAP
ncbi:MAG: hypothetical protein GQE15_38275 [Archangiaceae bacterium]|nr:hypothetical protein [Archangiaceae bacterium]